MVNKYVKLLASVFIVFSLSSPAKSGYGKITIDGRVVFEDSSAFPNAVVTVIELRGRLFMMPTVGQRVQVVADQEGNFSVNLSNVRGTLDIRAKHARCAWVISSAVQLEPKDWHNKDRVNVELDAVRGDCSIN